MQKSIVFPAQQINDIYASYSQGEYSGIGVGKVRFVIKQDGVELFSGSDIENVVLVVEQNIEIRIEIYVDFLWQHLPDFMDGYYYETFTVSVKFPFSIID